MRTTTLSVLLLLTASTAMAREVRRDVYGDPLPSGALMRLGTVRLRHGTGTIHCLAFAPDGKRLASGGDDYLIHLWDVRTGVELRRLSGHRAAVRALSFSPDGKTLASAGGDDGNVHLWDAATGRLLHTLKHDKAASSVIFFPDSKRFVSSDEEEGRIRVWSATTGECLRTWQASEDDVYHLSLSPDGKWLATMNEKIRLWDVATGKLVRVFAEPGQRRFDAAAFTPDGKKLAASASWGWIYLWDVETGKMLWKAQKTLTQFRALLFTPDGRTLISGDENGRIYRWDVTTGKEPRLLGRSMLTVCCLSLSPSGKLLASADCYLVIHLWDLTDGTRYVPAKGHDFGADKLYFAANDETLFSSSHDGTARAWDVMTGKQQLFKTFKGHVFLREGKRFVAANTKEKTVHLLDLMAGKPLAAFETAEYAEMLSFSRDGNVMAITTAKDGVEVWDVRGRRRRCRLRSGSDYPLLSDDGRWLVTFDPRQASGRDDHLYLWDTLSGKQRWRLSASQEDANLSPRCFSPDERMFACWESRENDLGQQVGRNLVVWEVRTGQPRLRLASPSTMGAVAFSPDSRLLTFGGGDEVIRVLDLRTGEERASFRGEQGEIRALAFSHDGRKLASSGEDTTILLWPLPRTTPARPAKRLSAEKMRTLWTDLASDDAIRAFRAMRKLHAAPDSTIAYLRANLRPIRTPDTKRVKQLLADLDADAFETREQASRQLASIAESIEPQLRQALREKPMLEARRRIQRLLDALAADSPKRWRGTRAIEVLEWLDTKESRHVLEELAGGAADAELTREAKAALKHRAIR